jgi:hypothetical protein
MTNIMIIGLGLHAQRAHLPALGAIGRRDGSGRASVIVDLKSRESAVDAALRAAGVRPDHVELLDDETAAAGLGGDEQLALDQLVRRHRIGAVIVSTEPTAHRRYVAWAAAQGLPVLLDKPVVCATGITHDPSAAQTMWQDFVALESLCAAATRREPGFFVNVVAHRRYHPGFQLARELVTEVADATGCPVTSLTAEYGDGEWRMPWEIVEQDYHPFHTGYGALSHSGYHAYDTAAWIATAGLTDQPLDSIETNSQFVMPADYLSQIPADRLRTLLPDAGDLPDRYTAQDLDSRGLGEVDAHSIHALQSRGRTLGVVSLHIQHASLSARAWARPGQRNLYTGNGRLKQEVYSIKQGPFQSIYLTLWQSSKASAAQRSLYEVGGDRHCEIQVFRNHRINPSWRPHDTYNLADLETLGENSLVTGPGKEKIMAEFLQALATAPEKRELSSVLASHTLATAMISSAYGSWGRSRAGQQSQVRVGLIGGTGRADQW